jgi:hypothetical protein
VLVVILANNMTARETLRLGDITLRLKEATCCKFFRSFVTNHPPPTLHLHPSSTVRRIEQDSHIIVSATSSSKARIFCFPGASYPAGGVGALGLQSGWHLENIGSIVM